MIQLGFTGIPNPSLQVGDIAYYVNVNTVAAFNQNFNEDTATTTEPVFMGHVQTIFTDPDDVNLDGTNIPIYNPAGTVAEANINNSDYAITINTDAQEPFVSPGENSFIFFAKDNAVNMAIVKGYYGEVEFRNNSTKPAELHATACEVEDSSD